MKKIIFISLALFAILAMSCSDEFTKQSSQSASVWRSTNFTDTALSTEFDYYEVRFISNNLLELWVKSKDNQSLEKVNQAYNYTIKSNTITIGYNDVTSTGTIDKSTMSITEDGISLKFIKI